MSEGNAFEPCFECPATTQASQASDADYVNEFMRHLADPEIKLLTEKPHDWHNHGVKGKAAILAALTENVQLRADRDSWKKGCEHWLNSATAMAKKNEECLRDYEKTQERLRDLCLDVANIRQGAVEQANALTAICDRYYRIAVGSVAANIVLLIALFAYYAGI